MTEQLSQGDSLLKLEKSVSQYVQVSNVIALNSATSALHILLKACGIKKGDWVLVPTISFVATANAVRMCDAEVKFVDVDLETGMPNIEHYEQAYRECVSEGYKVRALISVHLQGHSSEMKEIHKTFRERVQYIFEDASHAYGSTYQGAQVGCCEYSDGLVFSLHPVKIITSGEGGLICTKDANLAQKCRNLMSHGIVRDKRYFKKNEYSLCNYEMQDLGWNYRMPTFNAALAVSQMGRINRIISARRMNTEEYEKNLKNEPFKILNFENYNYSSNHLTIVRLPKLVESRKVYEPCHRKMIQEKGIGIQLHYAPIHTQPYYIDRYGITDKLLNSNIYAASHISIPNYVGLKKRDIKRVTESMIDIYK